MNHAKFGDDFDLTRIVVKPLYFGLVSNILLPMGLLLICYLLDQRNLLDNRLGSFANTLFILFCVLSFGLAAFGIWLRHNFAKQQMVRSLETFEKDFATSLLEQLRPVFLLISSISFFGPIYFFLTARFREAIFFVIASFVIFQVVRPRIGYVMKLIEKQHRMLVGGGESGEQKNP